MKLSLCTPANIRRLLVLKILVVVAPGATAQCTATNTAGTYTMGQTVCITASFSGSITLNNGSTMLIKSGGNYTGSVDVKNGGTITIQNGGLLSGTVSSLRNGATLTIQNGGQFTSSGSIDANSGSTITVAAGGTFSPGNANNFAAALSNTGTVTFSNVSLSPGASISNSGNITWQNNWNQNNVIAITNTSCGAMTYNQNTDLKSSGSSFVNNGTLYINGNLGMDQGATLNNRGYLSVNGIYNGSGYILNQYKMVFRGGGSNNINTGDSIVNLAYLTFVGAVSSNAGIRNEGLLTVGGSITTNSGAGILINNSNAQLRIKGAFSVNAVVRGNGSLHVAGSLANNNTIQGKSISQLLTVNKTNGTMSNFVLNPALAPADTATYTAAMANQAGACVVLPVTMSALQANYASGQVQLSWYDLASTQASSFTIEYSRDGQTYAQAGKVTAAGANNQTTRYQFTHSINGDGNLYYRIRETDADGSTYYSNVILVKTGNALTATMSVFPNPFTNYLQINLQLESAGLIQVALYDATGRLVNRVQQQGAAGRHTIAISGLAALPPGVYLVQIKAGDHTSFEKLIK